ncbi:unnamed protein product [Thelazia callipaeda]|uniref:MARVEL domain-containing protein n=1 Tax=Thelazia callipaeda TaxID=103827 RepID=A0A0N5D7R5_THECL|nr:unnamed protein product [Thelazia callipaeda]
MPTYREATINEEKFEKEPFVYNKDDDFYMAPACFHAVHYKNAAILCGIIEICVIAITVLKILSLEFGKENNRAWFLAELVTLLVFAVITTILMIYGIIAEKPKYLWPQMAFMHVEGTLLMILAVASVASMSMGLQATHGLFGLLSNIRTLEDHFGPIWPFNLAVVSFFGAAAIVWSYIIVRGAYDYLLDKDYFTKKPNIEMVKTIIVN